jgi:nicotinamidase-related amidase
MQNINGITVYDKLPEIVSPEHSCLIVWDVQNGLVNWIFNKEQFLTNLKYFIEKIRGRMPIVYTLITPPSRNFTSAWHFFAQMKRFKINDVNKLPIFMAAGSPDRDIPETVKSHESDIVLEKPSASIFFGTNFEYIMRSRKINTLIFTGIATEIGIESSARDAANRGFYPVVVEDCVSSMDKDAHERSLKNMAKLFIVETASGILKNMDRQ